MGNRLVQAFIGDLISSEYDLEGTVDQFSDWRDFFVGSEQTTDTLAHLTKKKLTTESQRAQRRKKLTQRAGVLIVLLFFSSLCSL